MLPSIRFVRTENQPPRSLQDPLNACVAPPIWDKAAKHFTEPELAAIVLWIATSNFFNRINVTTRQQAPQNWG
ncbi:hypothetical protein AB0F72_01425 [Actinoplanes sp. NPDC023936]|uniref:hypothetical protein n=1 Tax=Actinoplanes sp. NPDC023936 TaxID=3154910 RepID=UPI00340D9629